MTLTPRMRPSSIASDYDEVRGRYRLWALCGYVWFVGWHASGAALKPPRIERIVGGSTDAGRAAVEAGRDT